MPTDADEVLLRPAVTEDLPAIAEVFLASRAAAVPAMPPLVHSAEEVRAFVAGFDLTTGERTIWVAETAGRVLAYAELKDDWLDDLYVLPESAGQGIGGALLDLCKAARPDGFSLWVFESNEPARAFYRRRGLIELERTDGAGNSERSPDVRMAWPGANPLAFIRGRIDEVDDQVALLLAQRFALTAAAQQAKPVGGHAGRDPERERQIAERMAGPTGLPVAALERIMHTVITESLEVAIRNKATGEGR